MIRLPHLDDCRKYWKYVPRIFEVLLIVILAWTVVQFVFHPDKPDRAVQISSNTPTDILVDIKTLTATALFGKAEAVKKQPAVKQPVKPVAVSPLQLKLKGTVLAEGKSAAIIEPKPGAGQGVFFVGSRILPGVSLVSVAASYILIDDHGKREKVIMEESKGNENAGISALSSLSGLNTPRPNRPVGLVGNGAAGIPATGMNNQASGAHANFLNMVSLAGLTAHSENGKFQGMSVNQVIPGGLFSKAGLKKGDIIQSMNGKQLKNSQEAKLAYEEARKTGTINIVIIRDGQIQTIYQPLQ